MTVPHLFVLADGVFAFADTPSAALFPDGLSAPLFAKAKADLDVHYLEVGVPHAVLFQPGVDRLDDATVRRLGREIRFHPRFPHGTNVDFVEVLGGPAHHGRAHAAPGLDVEGANQCLTGRNTEMDAECFGT